MFIGNTDDCKIFLELGGIENNKDLFFFCIDIFFKGLVLLFGKDGKLNDIESITAEQLQDVQYKMSRAGIVLHVQVLPPDPDDASVWNIHEIESDTDEQKPINKYELYLNLQHAKYVVSFDLARLM